MHIPVEAHNKICSQPPIARITFLLSGKNHNQLSNKSTTQFEARILVFLKFLILSQCCESMKQNTNQYYYRFF